MIDRAVALRLSATAEELDENERGQLGRRDSAIGRQNSVRRSPMRRSSKTGLGRRDSLLSSSGRLARGSRRGSVADNAASQGGSVHELCDPQNTADLVQAVLTKSSAINVVYTVDQHANTAAAETGGTVPDLSTARRGPPNSLEISAVPPPLISAQLGF